MKKMIFRKLFLLSVAALLFSSCSYTKLTSSWFDMEAPARHYKKIGVVVLAPEKSKRSMMESNLVAALKENNINAINTLGVFPRAGNIGELEMDEDELKAAIRETVTVRRIDALLIVSLLDIKEEQYYVEGDSKTNTEAYYGGYGRPYAYNVQNSPTYNYGLYNYYYTYSNTVQDPGYYINNTSYFLETNLFDVATEKLIWSAQTTTTNPTSIQKEIKTYAGLIADQILHDRVLK